MSDSQIKSRGLASDSQRTSRLKGYVCHRPMPLAARLNKIQLFLCDFDGVLTDASAFVGGAGEIRQFNIQDGLGLMLLRRAGIKVGWISSRPSPDPARRAAESRIDFLLQGRAAKVAAIESILAQTGLLWSEVSCVTGAACGHGAGREAAALILKAQQKWDRLVSEYAA
jgi:3-deoxy-D-manno-octulosonate 8-phosphate phosphatase (KDO 8-P phosphatase)